MIEAPLNRKDVITSLSKDLGVDLNSMAKSLRVRTDDHLNNPLAPERYCYKVTFTLWGVKSRLAYWPETIGYQGY
jgi:hypothetical protein